MSVIPTIIQSGKYTAIVNFAAVSISNNSSSKVGQNYFPFTYGGNSFFNVEMNITLSLPGIDY